MERETTTLRARAAPAFAVLALLFAPSPARADWLTAEQKERADRLISVFENDTPEIQYCYVEKLKDGRGYTAGRGFTTRTKDAYEVVRVYDERVREDHPLKLFLPTLKRRAEQDDGSTDGLEGFPEAWQRAAADIRFQKVQDEIYDKNVYFPAMRFADQAGARTPLARAALFDAVMLHGVDDDPDGVPALLARAKERAGGTPATGVYENAWLRAFLEIRKEDMTNPRDKRTKDEWSANTWRCDVFSAMLDNGQFGFTEDDIPVGARRSSGSSRRKAPRPASCRR